MTESREESIRITKIAKNHPRRTDCGRFGVECAREAEAFHRTISEYEPTPLVRLQGLAAFLGIRDLWVKDESRRFGLNAFKGLGGSYALHCLAKGRSGPLTFVTATDGNHGRGVAWAASRLGYESYVYLPKGSSAERLENIRKLGAHAEILDLPYDDVVRYAAGQAKKNGWILVQDTAWDEYEEIPELIMRGYTTMGYEIMRQLVERRPTHVFLQAGVGSMAGVMAAFLADCYGEHAPKIAVVEPEGADCIFRTAAADDGALHFCEGEMRSIMAGLCCGEPCTIAWDLLSDYADYALTCPDYVSANGMRILGNPLPGDERIVSGESGAVTTGLLAELMRRNEHAAVRDMLGLDKDSVVLCISTEGDTDREHYREIVWRGAHARPEKSGQDS